MLLIEVGEKMSSLRVASGLPLVGVAEPHIEERGVDAGGGCGGCGAAAAAISWYTGPCDDEEEAAVVAVGL